MNYIPDFLGSGPTFAQTFNAVLAEIQAWRDAGLGEDGIQQQLFIQTATWGLPLWEEFMGVPTDETRAIEVRRAAIMAKLQGFGSMTPTSFKAYVEKITGRAIEVTEVPGEYRISVRILGDTGIAGTEEIVAGAIESVKPAHIAAAIVYAYMTWRYALDTGLTWGAVAGKTWEELRTFQ